ncbi:hypothetical protein D3C86_1520870 [compost metagenome]
MSTVVFTLAAIGAVALAVDDAKLRPSSSGDLAAWVQALAATLAIFASAVLAIYIQTRDYREKRKASVRIAADVALYAKAVLTFTRQELADATELRQRSADGATVAHFGLDDLCSLVSQFDVQSLPEPALTQDLLLMRYCVHEVRRTVDSALQGNSIMDGEAEARFFKFLDSEVEFVNKTCTKLSKAAKSI